MKHRFGFVIAVGVGLFGQTSVFAQQPAPPVPALPPAPPAPPAAPPSDKPPADQARPPVAPPSDKPPADQAPPAPPGDSVGGQTDPNTPPAPKAPEATPNAPPAPPPAGAADTAQPVPPPVTLPPYLTGGSTPITILPPVPPVQPPVAIMPPPPGPGADAGVTRKKGEAYLRWRGSGVSWNHAVSTTALGIGGDYISSDNQQYTQGLSATLNYFLIEPKDAQGRRRGYSLRAATTLGFDVELTNSDTTTKKYEKQLRDTPLSFVLGKTLYRSADEQSAVALNMNGTLIFPTSPTTYGQGIFFGVSPRATLIFQIPLRGKDASFLQGVTTGLSTSYTHRFSRAETPTNPDIHRVRQSTTGSLIVSDQLSGRSLSSNNFRVGGWAYFSEKVFGKDLWIQIGGGATYQFVNQFEAPTPTCAVVTQTGCATAQHVPNPLSARVQTDFGISLNYFPSAEWGIGLSYDNVTGQLAPDGTRRNPFYSPDAQISASILVSLDAIVERLQGNVREDPVIYFGQNRQKQPVSSQPAPLQAVF